MRYLILLVLFPALSLGRVTQFTNCLQFFFRNQPPTVLPAPRFRQICQCLLDNNGRRVYYFATLYDTRNRIPVYSAYIFQYPPITRIHSTWRIEPRLDGLQGRCMELQGTRRGLGGHQALRRDYNDNRFDIGHLYPVSHTNNQQAMMATFTLTNAAPQTSSFNRGSWQALERRVRVNLRSCQQAFVVTGVVPDNNLPLLNGRVKKSRYYWTATCCIRQNLPPQSRGYFGPNNNNRVTLLTLRRLERGLNAAYGNQFSVFGGNC